VICHIDFIRESHRIRAPRKNAGLEIEFYPTRNPELETLGLILRGCDYPYILFEMVTERSTYSVEMTMIHTHVLNRKVNEFAPLGHFLR
jgi:hypothetical protein